MLAAIMASNVVLGRQSVNLDRGGGSMIAVYPPPLSFPTMLLKSNDSTSNTFTTFCPQAITGSVGEVPNLISIVGTGLDHGWSCKFGRLGGAPATFVDSNRLLCPVPLFRRNDAGDYPLSMYRMDTGSTYKFDQKITVFSPFKIDLTSFGAILGYGQVHVKLRSSNVNLGRRQVTVQLRNPQAVDLYSRKVVLSGQWSGSNGISIDASLPKLDFMEPGLYRVMVTLDNQTFVTAKAKLRVCLPPSPTQSKLLGYKIDDSDEIRLNVLLKDANGEVTCTSDVAELLQVITEGDSPLNCTSEAWDEIPRTDGVVQVSCFLTEDTLRNSISLTVLGVPVTDGIIKEPNPVPAWIPAVVLVVLFGVILVMLNTFRIAAKAKKGATVVPKTDDPDWEDEFAITFADSQSSTDDLWWENTSDHGFDDSAYLDVVPIHACRVPSSTTPAATNESRSE